MGWGGVGWCGRGGVGRGGVVCTLTMPKVFFQHAHLVIMQDVVVWTGEIQHHLRIG